MECVRSFHGATNKTFNISWAFVSYVCEFHKAVTFHTFSLDRYSWEIHGTNVVVY